MQLTHEHKQLTKNKNTHTELATKNMNKKKIQNLKITFRHVRILTSPNHLLQHFKITFNCLNTSMKNSDTRIQHLQEIRIRSQLKISPVQQFPWKKENKHALLDVYQMRVLPRTHKTWVHPSCTQLCWVGRTREFFGPHFCHLEQLELIWTCMKLQKSIKFRSRINFCLCHCLDFQTTFKKNLKWILLVTAKQVYYNFPKLPSQSRDWLVWHHQKMKVSLAKKGGVTICLPFKMCFSKTNKQKNTTKKPHPHP